MLERLIKEYENKVLSVEECIKKLDISRSTFYRLLKEYR